MRPFLRDLTCGFRALRATPAVALAAVLTIALGTGANTAVFAVAYGVLLRPLPCPEPSRIVVVSFHAPNGNEFGVPLTGDRGLAAPCPRLRGDGGLQRRRVDHSRHRRASSRQDRPGHAVVLRCPSRGPARRPRRPRPPIPTSGWFSASRLSGQLARSGQSAAQLLGSPVIAGDRGLHVSAVMPPEFGFPAEDVAAWIPAAPFSRIRLASGKEIPRSFRLLARLKDGVSIEQARDDAQRAFSEVATTRQGQRHDAVEDPRRCPVRQGPSRPQRARRGSHPGPARGLRERGHAPGQSRRGPQSRPGRPAVARRQPLAARARRPRREPADSRCRVRARDRARAGVRAPVRPRRHRGRSAAGRDRRRPARSGGHRARRLWRHAHLRTRARHSRHPLRFRSRVPRFARERVARRPPDAPGPHRRSDCDLDRAPQRRRPDCAHAVRV